MTNHKFVLQIMPQTSRFSGDHEKNPAIVSSRVDSSSCDEDTLSTSSRVAWAFQNHYERGWDDITLWRGIGIASRTRSRCSVEIVSVSLQSCTAFGVGPSRVARPKDRRGLEGDDLKDEIMFDLKENLEADDIAGPTLGALRHNTYRSRYLLS